jgi:hypothetical protein
MTSDQFVAWIEQTLTDAGVRKVVPDETTLAMEYQMTVQQARRQAVIDAAIEAALKDFQDEPVDIPPDLRSRVAAALPVGTRATWKEILHGLAGTSETERR